MEDTKDFLLTMGMQNLALQVETNTETLNETTTVKEETFTEETEFIVSKRGWLMNISKYSIARILFTCCKS